VLEGLYDDPPLGIPKQVLVPHMPDDPELYEDYLCELRGSRVEIKVPQRGEKVRLQETVTHNAKEAFARHRLKRASDHNSRARALNELQEHLGLPEAPLRIECYDMSHFQGTDYVGSMVVTEDGLPKKSEYRRFKIKEVDGNNDFAAMEEVLRRRASPPTSSSGRSRPASGRASSPTRPSCCWSTAARASWASAINVLKELDLFDEIPVASLAKQFEEVYVPGKADPITIPRQSEALYLLQRLRDESHRFAITYHRTLRDKRMKQSVLDDVPGLGPTRRKRLVKELGGVTVAEACTTPPPAIPSDRFRSTRGGIIADEARGT
jgi:excinuclease ABC subunit C